MFRFPFLRSRNQQEVVKFLVAAFIVAGSLFTYHSVVSGEPQTWSVDPHNQVAVGRTPLMNAILAGQISQANTLLSQNPYQVNGQDSLGWTPLLCACLKGETDIAERIIKAGGAVNLTNRIGKTPLIYAIQDGDTDLALFLLNHGADPDFPDESGATPLMWAASTNDGQVVSDLVTRHVGVNHKDKRGFTPIAVAALTDGADVAQPLIKNGADVNVSVAQDSGETPLMYAISARDETFADEFLDAHADVNVHTLDGFTPLMLAAQNGLTDNVVKLLARGAHPNGSLADGMTALDFACASPDGTLAMVQALVNAGARVNGNANDNGTPLMYAANAGHGDIVKFLLAHGADSSRVTNRGMTALHWADGEGYQSTIGQSLRKAGEQF